MPFTVTTSPGAAASDRVRTPQPPPRDRVGRMRKLRLAGLLLAVTLVAGACGQREQAGQAPGRPPGMSATSLAVPPAGTPDKPCLHGVEAAGAVWVAAPAGAVLVGVV